jgi:hypothetical protein
MKSMLTIVAVVLLAVILGLAIVAKHLPPGDTTTGAISEDTGVRDIIRDGKTCKEYFRLRDSRVVKTECPP